MNSETTRKTIMVVDDDPMYRELLTFGLERAGYATVTAENGAAAAALIEKERPDVILTDMLMPIMDGFKFLKWMKEKAKLDVPTVIVTSLDNRKLFVDALVAGAADVLLKPVGLDVLLEKLNSILGPKSNEVEPEWDSDEEHGALEPDLRTEL